MTQETLTSFFGWMVVLNFGFLILTTILLVALKDWAAGIHARLFGMERTALEREYFAYLANFKIAAIIFSLMPYLALKLM